MIPRIWNHVHQIWKYPERKIGKPVETESRSVVAQGWGEGPGGSHCLVGMGFPFGVMKMFCNWTVVVLHDIVNVQIVTELYVFK